MSELDDWDAEEEREFLRIEEQRRMTRADWQRSRRLTTAALFDHIADTATDEQCANTARWQASVFRWSAEHTR